MTPTTRLHRPEVDLARRQHGVVARSQLLELGLSADAIRHRVAAQRLFVVHRGVYAVGRLGLTRDGRWMAAVLACGPSAALSHVPAGLLWRILERGDERPHVSVPSGSHRTGPPGVVVHRADRLRPVTRSGMAVTGLSDTIVDLAGDVEQRTLKAVVRQAVRAHRLDLRLLQEQVSLPLSDWRKARVRNVLGLWLPNVELTQSEMEARFYELIAAARLPLPELQRPFGPYRSDFVWPAAKLVVETDGRDHDSPVARQEDAARDRALAAAGFVVLRFRWADVVNRPAEVVREVRAMLTRLSRGGR